jgi:hypothetical protein
MAARSQNGNCGLILQTQKTHRTQEALTSLRSYYDWTGQVGWAEIPSARAQSDEAAPRANLPTNSLDRAGRTA